MKRRAFITLLGGATAASWPRAARAQQPDDRVRTLQMHILSMRADALAQRTGWFLYEMQSQIGWTTMLPWSAGTTEQRRFDGLRLLRQVPAITELTQLDATGKEKLHVSRLAMDVVGNNTDFSQEPKFTEAVAKKIYYGPVYLARMSSPYMTLSLAGTRRDAGVSVAMVSLKLIWDIVRMKVGEQGVAYIVDAQGRVIAHSHMVARVADAQGRIVEQVDTSLFLRDFSGSAHVQAARAAGFASGTGTVRVARDIDGRDVLAAYAPIGGPGWLAFVELPIADADTPSR